MSMGYIDKTCYMCSRYKTSKEHVPPFGFFPEGHRNNLITVPSCNLHNSNKSGEDEFLRIYIATSIDSNKLGVNDIYKKVKRSFEKRPGKRAILKNPKLIRQGNVMRGTFAIDKDRFDDGIKNIARGLYNYEYKDKWLDEIKVFMPSRTLVSPSEELNLTLESIENISRGNFRGVNKVGNNQEVFYYQIIGEKNHLDMRMTFYGGFTTLLIFS